jgi:hypothetical protein
MFSLLVFSFELFWTYSWRDRISGITLLTSMIEVKRNKFQNFTLECHVDNKEWFTSQFFEVTERWCPKFCVPNCIICFKNLNKKIHHLLLAEKKKSLNKLHFFLGWPNLPPKFDIEFIYLTQNNYYVQKGGRYHIIPFE